MERVAQRIFLAQANLESAQRHSAVTELKKELFRAAATDHGKQYFVVSREAVNIMLIR